jgi:hypothetical protein
LQYFILFNIELFAPPLTSTFVLQIISKQKTTNNEQQKHSIDYSCGVSADRFFFLPP